MADEIRVTLKKERETKNTIRSEVEPTESREPPIAHTIYFQKWALRWPGDPEAVTVIVATEP